MPATRFNNPDNQKNLPQLERLSKSKPIRLKVLFNLAIPTSASLATAHSHTLFSHPLTHTHTHLHTHTHTHTHTGTHFSFFSIQKVKHLELISLVSRGALTRFPATTFSLVVFFHSIFCKSRNQSFFILG